MFPLIPYAPFNALLKHQKLKYLHIRKNAAPVNYNTTRPGTAAGSCRFCLIFSLSSISPLPISFFSLTSPLLCLPLYIPMSPLPPSFFSLSQPLLRHRPSRPSRVVAADGRLQRVWFCSRFLPFPRHSRQCGGSVWSFALGTVSPFECVKCLEITLLWTGTLKRLNRMKKDGDTSRVLSKINKACFITTILYKTLMNNYNFLSGKSQRTCYATFI